MRDTQVRAHRRRGPASTLARTFALVLTTALLALGLGAAPAQAANGTISGTVTGAGGGVQSDVDVTVYYYDADWGGWDWYDSTTTAGDGTYSLSVEPGEYKLKFEPAVPGDWGHIYYNQKDSLEDGNTVSVTSGGSHPGINAVLPRTGKVTGTVRDSVTNDPIPDATVDAYEMYDDGDDSWWNWVGYAYADANGDYELFLNPGTYRIGFDEGCCDDNYGYEYWNDEPTVEDADDVVVVAETTSPGKNAALDPHSTVTGMVSSSGGQSVDDVEVYAWQEYGPGEWDWGYTADVDASGHYELEVPAGTYRIGFKDWEGVLGHEFYNNVTTVTAATDVVVPFNATVPNINASLAPGGTIAGTVTNGSTALDDICISIHEPSGAMVAYDSTSSNGSYAIPGLATGSYKVQFYDCGDGLYASEWYNDQPDIDSANAVVVTGGTTTSGINAVLALDGSTPHQPSAACVTATQKLTSAEAKVAATMTALDKAKTKVKKAKKKVKKLKTGPSAKLAKAKKQLKKAKKSSKKAKRANNGAVAARNASATAKVNACK